jgi:hypothetical protein
MLMGNLDHRRGERIMRTLAGRVNPTRSARASADSQFADVPPDIRANAGRIAARLRQMRTSITVPDRLFEDAERFAAQRGMSRSDLYAHALAHFMESQSVLGVRERLDSVYAARPQESDLEPGVATLQSESLVRKW